jgi:hypothetical protein
MCRSGRTEGGGAFRKSLPARFLLIHTRLQLAPGHLEDVANGSRKISELRRVGRCLHTGLE